MARVLGSNRGDFMVPLLDPVMLLCHERGYPPLTALVVNMRSGRPGDGIRLTNQLDVLREQVFGFDWFGVEPPETEDFRLAVENARG